MYRAVVFLPLAWHPNYEDPTWSVCKRKRSLSCGKKCWVWPSFEYQLTRWGWDFFYKIPSYCCQSPFGTVIGKRPLYHYSHWSSSQEKFDVEIWWRVSVESKVPGWANSLCLVLQERKRTWLIAWLGMSMSKQHFLYCNVSYHGRPNSSLPPGILPLPGHKTLLKFHSKW